jgi:hypothetical protein
VLLLEGASARADSSLETVLQRGGRGLVADREEITGRLNGVLRGVLVALGQSLLVGGFL